MSKTDARVLLVSRRTEESAKRTVSQTAEGEDVPRLVTVAPYSDMLPKDAETQNNKRNGQRGNARPSDSPGAIILHSSGTTGLPKPIRLSHRYVIGYAGCHRLSVEEAAGRLILSTLPLYHVRTLLAKIPKDGGSDIGIGLWAFSPVSRFVHRDTMLLSGIISYPVGVFDSGSPGTVRCAVSDDGTNYTGRNGF
jgi:long-subunit acyl-CoA synthetase (AMP-forming)